MASKTKAQSGEIEYRKFGESVSFVLDNLDEKESEKLEAMPIDTEVFVQMLDKSAELGFVASAKFDAYSKCWLGTLICNGRGFSNVGLAVSGRSRAGVCDALFVALYKLFYVADGDLTKFGTAEKKQWKRG